MKLHNQRASAGKPIPGYDIKIFDENGYELDAHQEGYLIKLPLPPGALLGIWNDYDRFQNSYFLNTKVIIFPEMEPLKMKTDIFSSQEEWMMSLMLQDTDFRLQKWKKLFRPIPMLQNVQ
jgi:hypothetical protein